MLLNCGVGEDSLRVPWTARRSNQSIQKEINPEYSLKGLMLKLKLQYFGDLMWRIDSLEKTLSLKDWRREEKGTTEDEIVGWHHWLNGHEFEHAPEVGDGQGSLVWCSPQGCKMLDMTEQLNWTSKMPSIQFCDLFKDLLSSVGCVTFKGRFYVFNIILYLWWVVACWMFQLKCTEHDMFEK